MAATPVRVWRVREPFRCLHCGGNLVLEAVEGESGIHPVTYALVCFLCCRVHEREMKPDHGYHSRLYWLVRGVSAESLDRARRGATVPVWESAPLDSPERHNPRQPVY